MSTFKTSDFLPSANLQIGALIKRQDAYSPQRAQEVQVCFKLADLTDVQLREFGALLFDTVVGMTVSDYRNMVTVTGSNECTVFTVQEVEGNLRDSLLNEGCHRLALKLGNRFPIGEVIAWEQISWLLEPISRIAQVPEGYKLECLAGNNIVSSDVFKQSFITSANLSDQMGEDKRLNPTNSDYNGYGLKVTLVKGSWVLQRTIHLVKGIYTELTYVPAKP